LRLDKCDYHQPSFINSFIYSFIQYYAQFINTHLMLHVFTHNECCFMSRVHCVSTNRVNLFLSELRQISTNFGNFWQNDGKEAIIMQDALIFHFTYLASPHYRVKRRSYSKLSHNGV